MQDWIGLALLGESTGIVAMATGTLTSGRSGSILNTAKDTKLKMRIEETDLSKWTDKEIIHVCESSGVSWKVFAAIKHPRAVEVDDEDYDDWKKPEYAAVRRTALESYLYGMHMADLSCKKWHKHCRDKY